MSFRTIIEPFKAKTVEPIKMSVEEERKGYLKEAHFNPFLLDSEKVIIDLLTDSGTSAMSADQWGGMMEGDEAYAGSRSWKRMEKVIRELTGFKYILPTHQGRAGERILYGLLGGEGKVFYSNTHFDTTRANIEFSGAEAIDLPTPVSKDTTVYHPFKGDLDVDALEKEFQERGTHNVGAVILTMTNNSGGGQPVSMKNVQDVSALCWENGVKFFIDCCRIAENAYFIKEREEGFRNWTPEQIAQKAFSLCDGAVMSAKKDALVNMGGFIALKDEKIHEKCKELLIITEGYITYGGLSGRDMEAIAIGLEEVFEPDYLQYRIRSTQYLGEKLKDLGVPLIWPIGGHAVYVDAKAFYPDIPVEKYPGQVLVCELYKKGGVRAVEIGSVMFGKYDDNGELIPAPYELVRLAIPRRVYTQSHIEYVIEVFEKLIQGKKEREMDGLRIVKEPKMLRHFSAEFEPIKAEVKA